MHCTLYIWMLIKIPKKGCQRYNYRWNKMSGVNNVSLLSVTL